MGRGTVPGFAAAIRRIREERKMSIDDLAASTGINRNSIAKIEREERSPSLRIALALAVGLGVSLDLLCGRWQQEDDQHEPKRKK